MDSHPEKFSTYGSEIGCDRRTLLKARDLVWGGGGRSTGAGALFLVASLSLGIPLASENVVMFQGCNQSSCTLGTELDLTMFRCLRKAIKFLRQSDSQLKLGLRRRGPWERGSCDLKITEC